MAKKKQAHPDQFSLFDLPPAPPRASPTRAVQPPLPMDLGPVAPPPPTPPPGPWTPHRTGDGTLELEEALRLECNLALMAGAGTGKTYSLITLCLQSLRCCFVHFPDVFSAAFLDKLRAHFSCVFSLQHFRYAGRAATAGRARAEHRGRRPPGLTRQRPRPPRSHPPRHDHARRFVARPGAA